MTDQNQPVSIHSPDFAGLFCPLCGEFGADRYVDHGGLCVCQQCGKTFDPELEPLPDGRSRLEATKAMTWTEKDQADRKDRLRLRRMETPRVRTLLDNVDGRRKLRNIPNDVWRSAVDADAQA